MKNKMFLIVVLAIMLVLPLNVLAITEDEIKESKEIKIKSVPPTSENTFWQFSEYFNEVTGFYIDISDCNADYTVCTVTKIVENSSPTVVATDVTINYQYDKDIKAVVDGILSKIPENGINFTLNDIEAIYYASDISKYYRTNENPTREGEPYVENYAGEYKSFIGYKNFRFEARMGYDEQYESKVYGTGTFTYDGTIYGYTDGISITAPFVLYVDSNVTDVASALQTRLDKYFPGIVVEEDNSYSPQQHLESEIANARNTFNTCKGLLATVDELQEISNNDPTEENQANLAAARRNFENSCLGQGFHYTYDFSDVDAYLQDYEADLKEFGWGLVDQMEPASYTLKFTDGSELYFNAIKNSSKVFNDDIEVITSDAGTNITISSSTVIPLDTLIQVAKLTGGENYNKILNILENVINKENAEMFDLKLFSKSANEYINKLDNGTFEVKLPISDALKGKENLIVYYVSDDGKMEAHPVRLSDDKKFAIFTTDHFSIYTLGEQQETPEPKYKLTYNFNGGSRQGETEYVDESVSIGMNITKENFVDTFGVKAPDGKEIDAIEINGTRVELGSEYLLNKDTVFKYLWKDIPKTEEPAVGDSSEEEKQSEEQTTEPVATGEETPKTFDNINDYVIMLGISLIIVISSVTYYVVKHQE